jgi:hypothetical protein
MLISFAVANHLSILDRIELSLIGESRPTGAERAGLRVPGFDLDLVPAVALLGPNGAGKSNVLDALRFVSSAVANSQGTWRPKQPPPRAPFRLQDGPNPAPSSYEVVFAVEGVVYEYAFDIGPTWIEAETLDEFQNGPRSRARLFQRSASPGTGEVEIDAGRRLVGPRAAAVAATRPESLFLSAAAQNNHKQLTPIWSWLANSCHYAGPLDTQRRAQQTHFGLLRGDDEMKGRLREFLASADLGIAGVTVTEEAMPEEDISRLRRIIAAAAPDEDIPLEVDWTLPNAVFDHRGLVGRLELDRESAGTQAWYQWAGPVLNTIDSGHVLAADELDAHLNDQLASQIVMAFQSPETNEHAAQLLFTAQDPAVVTNAGLGRDQLWIVEKTRAGSTELVPATDFRGRREWDAGQAFRHGRYGGLPVIDTPNLRRTLAGGAPDDATS